MMTSVKQILATLLVAFAFIFSASIAMADSGSFFGINNHTASGVVSVEKRDGKYVVVLAEDFKFDGAPDPRIAFGIDGKYEKDTDFELLKSNSGAQEYSVPDHIDPSRYNEVHIWCRQYSVGLAIAKLK